MVDERYFLPDSISEKYNAKDPMTEYGRFLLYRTYSLAVSRYDSHTGQMKKTQENWFDICKRVTEGTFSIRKDYCAKNNLHFDVREIDKLADRFLFSMFNMLWSPPGRGLFKMGTDFVYERGSMCLNNCFSGDTYFLDSGIPVKFKDMEGKKVIVKCYDGTEREAVCKSFGYQRLNRVTLSCNGVEREVYCTENHRWLLKNFETCSLKVGDILVGGQVVTQIIPIECYEQVFCVTEPVTRSFTLDLDGMEVVTGNCGYVHINYATLPENFRWMADALMLGVGIGFGTSDKKYKLHKPKVVSWKHTIPDSREGWAEAIQMVLRAFFRENSILPVMDYSEIRPAGLPIRGFGGISSGPEPLKYLLNWLIGYLDNADNLSAVRIVCDIGNQIGKAVVAGNVRRSAEMYLGEPTDPTFLELKELPERYDYGYLSNNTARFNRHNFGSLGNVVKRMINRGEPGIANTDNWKLGRLKDTGMTDEAIGLNPCGEITLESHELCNVDETYPYNCKDDTEWLDAAIPMAVLYAQTVSMLLTHSKETNRVLVRNRRIGVGISGFNDWKTNCIDMPSLLGHGYHIARSYANDLADSVGVSRPIKVTTIKPGGTAPKVCTPRFNRRLNKENPYDCGTSGAGYPTFPYIMRRVNVARNNSVHRVIKESGIGYEESYYNPGTTDVFLFPCKQGPAKTVSSIWEQMANITMLQRNWADNAVSNTIYFRPKYKVLGTKELSYKDALIIDQLNPGCLFNGEPLARYEGKKSWNVSVYDPAHEEDEILPCLEHNIHAIKSVSFLPIVSDGVYIQTPETEITEDVYNISAKPGYVDYSNILTNENNQESDNYCSGDTCQVIANK